MRYISFIILLLPLICVGQNIAIDKNYSYGLTFRSHEVNKDERTSLDLLPQKPLDLKGGFTLEFDLRLQQIWDSYGYVLRIVANDSTSIDMTSFARERRINVILNNTKSDKFVSEFRMDQDFPKNDWVKILIIADGACIKYSIAGKEVIIDQPMTDLSIDKIFFGANKYGAFFTSDVPPMSIKDVIIRNKQGVEVRNWSMNKHGEYFVKDNTNGYFAMVENPVWEIDSHVKWQKEQTLIVNQIYPQIATDSILRRVFVVTSDSLYIMNLNSKKIEKIKVREGSPYRGASSYLVYDYKNDRLISYNVNKPLFITYDFKSNSWSGVSDNTYMHIQHHNRFIDYKSNRLVLFGGYGDYTYKAILNTHDLDSGGWISKDLKSEISPRYLASSGYLGDNKLLILGGYGSETGSQEVGAQNYYDLEQIDIVNKSCIKLGEIKQLKDHYTFGNSMVIDKAQNKFYTLGYRNDVYKSSLNLFEVNLTNLELRIFDDSIPYNFHDIESFCDLFLYQNKCLYAVVSHKVADKRFEISVYSLLYSPLSALDVSQTDNEGYEIGNLLLYFTITIFIIAFLILAIYYIKKKRTDKKFSKIQVNEDTNQITFREEIERYESRILLLGNYRIFDRDGNDVVWHFSPITKQILMFCLLESLPTKKGITSEELDNEFWADMDKAKATNNRNVNIRKLRLLLQEVGNITLIKENGYWKIVFGEHCSCDYVEIMELLNTVKQSNRVDKVTIERIIKIGSEGPLLPNVDIESIDRYKSEYSLLLVDILLMSLKLPEIKNDLKLLVELSDVILLHDNIDEDAIQLKCQSLYQLGQKGLSKQCYNKFCSDYKNILNEDPKLKYEAIISRIQ